MFRKPLIRRRSDGTYVHSLPQETMELIADLAAQLESVLDEDAPELRRLHPTAYSNDPEKDAGYQILARDQLTDGRRAAIATVIATVEQDQFDDEELNCWMRVVNDIRLVLGTRLDVSEDDDHSFYVELDDDASDEERQALAMRQIYDLLGNVVGEIVDALMRGLDD